MQVQSDVPGNRRHVGVVLAAIVVLGAVAGLVVQLVVGSPREPSPRLPETAPVTVAVVTVEQKAHNSLVQAQEQSRAALEARVRTLAEFLARGRAGARDFAQDALSWSSKWALVQQTVGLAGKDEHRQYLMRAFGRHLYTSESLQAALESAVTGFLLDLEAIESALLVQLRADLAENEPSVLVLPEPLRSDETFRKECQRLTEEAARRVRVDSAVTLGKEVGVFVTADVAGQVVLRVLRLVGAELGLKAGLLGVGAASSLTNLGASLVGAILLDYLIDAVLELAGYTPVEQIRQKVEAGLTSLEHALIDGEKGMRAELDRLHQSRAQLRQQIVATALQERRAGR